ncbi:MAG: N-acetyltransferase family protein [Pseudomonadota bacterium]|nr:N-acetyltransferase family protein [Pseudomonadota bacterium]
MQIRDSIEADLPGMLAIYNAVIASSTAVFSEAPVTLENRRAWRAARLEAGYPVLSAEEGGEVIGFGALGPFRVGDGYRATVEHSVHVREDRRGRGVGTALLEALIRRAEAQGARDMIAGLDAANAGSIRMHERLGFESAALLPDVAEKWGRRLDLMLMRKRLA